jgi:hypothetical protein
VVENSLSDSAPVTAEFTGEVKGEVQEEIDSALWGSPLHTRGGARRGKVPTSPALRAQERRRIDQPQPRRTPLSSEELTALAASASRSTSSADPLPEPETWAR